jgi:hypothetical protein
MANEAGDMKLPGNSNKLIEGISLNPGSSVQRVVRFRNVLGLALLLGLTLGNSCNPTAVTVFQASFNNDTVGSPPAANQDTGTLTFNAAAGKIKVVNTAPGASSTKWVQITEDSLRGNFSRVDGPGKYGFLASLVIPSTTGGTVSLAFQPDFDQQVQFMHVDFMPQGNVRVDDGSTTFGQFPKGKPFTVSVKLNITSTNGTAEITLFGTGASGSTTVNVNPILMTPAKRFGAVRFFMGDQQHGTFFVKDIIVTRTS